MDLKNEWESAYKNVNLDSNSNIKHSKAKLENGEDVVISDEKLGKQPNNKKVRSVLEKIVGVKWVLNTLTKILKMKLVLKIKILKNI